MKVYKGTMYRIIVEKACGCRATQEYKDAIMKEADGEPLFKPCSKHKRGQVGEIIKELMFEVVSKEADDHQKEATLAIAQANATRIEDTPAPPAVGEGAESESRTTIKVGSRVVQKVAPSRASSAPITAAGRPDTTKARNANLSSGSAGGLRRAGGTSAAASASAAIAAKKAELVAPASNSIDAELSGEAKPVSEDPRITRVLVDGALMGDLEDDPSAEQ